MAAPGSSSLGRTAVPAPKYPLDPVFCSCGQIRANLPRRPSCTADIASHWQGAPDDVFAGLRQAASFAGGLPVDLQRRVEPGELAFRSIALLALLGPCGGVPGFRSRAVLPEVDAAKTVAVD